MAFKRYKRFGARSARKRVRYSRRRRFYRRSRAGRSFRRGRKFPRSTETKVLSASGGASWNFEAGDLEPENYTFKPMHVFRVFKGATDTRPGIACGQGTGINERIGAKITPIKLRFSGSISFSRDYTAQIDYVPRAFAIRMIVYQVRGGNGQISTADAGYHPLCLVADADGMCGASEITKLLGTYGYGNGQNPDIYTQALIVQNMSASKSPLRLGIGGNMRMLYTKTWTLQTGTRSSIPFRIVTKLPRRIVYTESTTGANGNQAAVNPRNTIFAAFLLVPMNANVVGRVDLRYQCDCFYIDK